MNDPRVTDADLVVLGLLAEQPRHGYDLDAVIQQRGIRGWTSLAFSSIYYVLNRLESRGWVLSEREGTNPRGRRIYRLTPEGLRVCTDGTQRILTDATPQPAPVLIGMANTPLLPPDQVAAALNARRSSLAARRDDIAQIRATQEPLEPFVAAIFVHSDLALEAELAWIEHTLASLSPATPTAREDTLETYDIKKAHPTLYAPNPGDFHVVEVPELSFLMTDGHGDPNVSTAYTAAVEALFSLSYAVRAIAKSALGRVHTVGPLEGLWSADDPRAFVARDKCAWDWTMMIAQPAWISPDIVGDAMKKAQKKSLPALERVRFEPYTEGTSVQILHIGSYDSEAPVLARLHGEYLSQHGLTFNGKHHEVYLSDPRRTETAKLRTILRQPVASVSKPRQGTRAEHTNDAP